MRLTMEIRLLFVVPLTILSGLIMFVAFYPWFASVFNSVNGIIDYLNAEDILPKFYSLVCNDQLVNADFSNTKIVFSQSAQQYYLLLQNELLCVIQSSTDVPSSELDNLSQISITQRQILLNELMGNMNRIIQIAISCSAIGIVLIIALINHYSRRLAYMIVEPIDGLTSFLRNIDEENMDDYFSEMLQGEKSAQTPVEMGMLLRSVYDFIGIVKIANQAFIQGNDSQAIIGYAVANQFYLENGNILGAGVIQNNMGVIHMRNKRHQEAISCFRESIICIENEWEAYKMKYEQFGIHEDELIIDSEYQNLSSIVFNRCFNLSEALTEFLLSESLELQEFIYSIRTHRASQTSMESRLFAQMHMPTDVDEIYSRHRHSSVLQSKNDITLDQLAQRKSIRTAIHNLIQIHDIMYPLRIRFLGTHDQEYAQTFNNTAFLNESDIKYLILHIWKDAIKAYTYCKQIMDLQLNSKLERSIYITLKIILGYLNIGQIDKCEILFKELSQPMSKLSESLSMSSQLKQKHHLYMGQMFYKQGYYSQAAAQLYQSLMMPGKFSARDRITALVLQKAIFDNQTIHHQIDKCLLPYQPVVRDIHFVIENSRRMKQQLAIIRAINVCSRIMTQIQSSDDRISYGFISSHYLEIIPLIPKVQNQIFIDRTIKLVPQPHKRINQKLNEVKYQPHFNSELKDNYLQIKRNGVEPLRYRRLLIYICWEYEFEPNDMEQIIIPLSGKDYQNKNHIKFYEEANADTILPYYEQLKLENAGSNFYLEQTI